MVVNDLRDHEWTMKNDDPYQPVNDNLPEPGMPFRPGCCPCQKARKFPALNESGEPPQSRQGYFSTCEDKKPQDA